MGIGPVFAVPKLLKRFGLSIDDIGLWELNEAFAVQVLYCQDRLGIPVERLNVSGGAISIGHPYGMSGERMVGHALIEGKRDRKSVVEGKGVSVRVDLGGGRIIKKKQGNNGEQSPPVPLQHTDDTQPH